MRILIVEDDKQIAEALALTLTNQHFTVDTATDGQDGWEQAQMFDYDLILLDVVLPKIDGITLCRKLRATRENTPIILLTSRQTSEDKVKGLDAGADDYLVKPFNFEELSARIRALLRRGTESLSPIIKWGNLSLNPSTCEVNYAGNILNLTPKEYGIIQLLMHHNKRVFSCSAILDKLWSFEEIPTEDTVRTHIKGLRQKLKKAGAPKDLIQTVYGLGYRLKIPEKVTEPSQNFSKTEEEKLTDEGAKEAPKLINRLTDKQSQNADDRAQKLNQAMAQIWEKFKGSMSDRLDVLTRALKAAREDKLEDELQQQAHREAHKLAGSLGTFGLAKSSQIAKKIEEILATELPLKAEETSLLSQLVNTLHLEVERESKNNQESQGEDFNTLDRNCGRSPLLLIVSPDSKLSQELVREARKREIQAQAFPEISSFLKIIQNQHFSSLSLNSNVVLLDLDIYGNYEKTLRDLAAKTPLMSVVVLTTQGELSVRLKVAKYGVSAYLQKPVQPEVVINLVLDLLRESRTQAKVMIVDDDRVILETLQALLEARGINTLILDDERHFWETLEAAVPDLLVLDVEMPHINGIELCQVLRHDPRWSRLPVLFLTAHTNAELRHQIFAVGGDDYVSKPFIESELLTRIFNRIKRTKNI
jgi:DNA-binding response OmpR family regulator/HPt (histidine-containing phosphotransfer) domain-containing protein